MVSYIIRRIAIMIPLFFMISLLLFWIIQLPPGDYLTSLVAIMAQQGDTKSRGG